MSSTSSSNSFSIFEGGRLKPGIYKIQNIHNEAYIDIEVGSRTMRCRPAQDLGEGRGLKWEIKPVGVGYTIQMVEPGRPDQFCAPMTGLTNGHNLYVSAYSAAWRIEVVDDDIHRGFEYVRIYWGTTTVLLEVEGDKAPNNKMMLWEVVKPCAWQIWKLVPVRVRGVSAPSHLPPEALGSDPLPSYDGDTTGQSSTHTQHAEPEYDEFGTIVNEVTVVTTTSTVTTRKRYRVEDA